jgi:phage-related protein
MIKSKITGIFPTPIYISELNRKFTNKELLFIDKTKLDVYKNEGNTTSNNNYILNNKAFKYIKTE